MYKSILKYNFVQIDPQDSHIINGDAVATAGIEKAGEKVRLKERRMRQLEHEAGQDLSQDSSSFGYEGSDDGSGDGFSEGLKADRVSLLLGDDEDAPGVIKADGDYSADYDYYGDGDSANSGSYASAQAGDPDAAMLVRAEEKLKQAEEYLTNAHFQSEKIIQEGKNEANNIMAKAREEGYNKGLAEGREAAADEIQYARDDFQRQVQELEDEYNSKLENAEAFMVEALTEIYESVFHSGLSQYNDVILNLLKGTLKGTQNTESVLIHASEEDALFLRDRISELSAILPGHTGMDIIIDETVGKGGCLVETDSGIIDCGLDTQLQGLRDKLTFMAGVMNAND